MRLEASVRTGEPAHIVEAFELLLQYKVGADIQCFVITGLMS